MRNYAHVVSFVLHRAIPIAQSTRYWGRGLCQLLGMACKINACGQAIADK